MDETSKAQALILVLFGAMGVWAQDLTVTLSYNVRLAPLVINIFNIIFVKAHKGDHVGYPTPRQ